MTLRKKEKSPIQPMWGGTRSGYRNGDEEHRMADIHNAIAAARTQAEIANALAKLPFVQLDPRLNQTLRETAARQLEWIIRTRPRPNPLPKTKIDSKTKERLDAFLRKNRTISPSRRPRRNTH